MLKVWIWKEKATRRKQINYFVKLGMKRQTILKKFAAAHYVARHQNSVADKLKWDETALQIALKNRQ